jgi:hypothetical protein
MRIYGVATYESHGADEIVATMQSRWGRICATAPKVAIDDNAREDAERIVHRYVRRHMRSLTVPDRSLPIDVLKAVIETGKGHLAALNALNQPPASKTGRKKRPPARDRRAADEFDVSHAAAQSARFEMKLARRQSMGSLSVDGRKVPAPETFNAWLEEHISSTEHFIHVAQCATMLLAAEPTEYKNDRLREFLSDIASVFERCGGVATANKPKVKGRWSPFVRWVHEILACIPESVVEPKSITALGAAITEWKQPRTQTGRIFRREAG